MSTTKTESVKPQGWLDYILMFVFIPVLHKKYSTRSQEPAHRVTWLTVFIAKTPLQALSAYLLSEYMFHKHLSDTFIVYLLLGLVFGFWEFIFHRVLHINKILLLLVKQRHIRERTQVFMSANPDLSLVLIWVNMLLIIAHLTFSCVYLGLIIVTPLESRGY